MGYAFSTNLGVRFDHGQWHIGIEIVSMGIVGSALVIAYCGLGADGWAGVIIIDGPYDDPTWATIMKNSGGMGAYIHDKGPQIDAALDKYFDPTPTFPPLTNQTPYSQESFNEVLRKYVSMEIRPNNDTPRLKYI